MRARKGYWALTSEETARVNNPKPEAPAAVTAALSTLATASRRDLVENVDWHVPRRERQDARDAGVGARDAGGGISGRAGRSAPRGSR